MKDPYSYLFNGVGFVFIDLRLYGTMPDILPDFLGYVFFALGIHFLPAFHNLKRWSKNFAIILTVLSFPVELDQWLGTLILGNVGEQFMQFLGIVFMYYLFQLLLHVHEHKPFEGKTFKTYQKFMALMLCGFVIQVFSNNLESSLRENVHFLGAFLQLIAYLLFLSYCRAGSKFYKETKEKKVHSLN